MSFSDSLGGVMKTLKSNAPEILTALGVTGVVTTAYLTAKASVQAEKMIERQEAVGGVASEPKQRLKEHAKLTWKLFVPPAISGAVTITAIIASQKASSRRTAVAVTAYSVVERAFSEYKDKVVETIGETKEQKLADEIAQEKVTKNPPNGNVIIIGTGQVLCCELESGRYFRSDMETLRRAENDVNQQAITGMGRVSLDDFYDLVGLPHTKNSDMSGWDFERNMHLIFSTVLDPHGEPCLAFEYNYVKPLYD